MELWQLAIYGAVGLAMSILSGIAGGGGGFIVTPLAIFLGLSPAQAVASGKFNGLAITIGSLGGLRKAHEGINKQRVAAIMALALVVGLLAPHIIKSLDSATYQLTLGILLLAMIPVMIYKKVGHATSVPTQAQRGLGGILLTLSLFLQGAFSGGLGALVNIVLMGLLGQSATEANVTKRWSQVVLNVTIIFGVLGSGLIVWPLVAVGVTTSLIGGFIGGRLAVRRGNTFVMNVLLALMAFSGVALIISAL